MNNMKPFGKACPVQELFCERNVSFLRATAIALLAFALCAGSARAQGTWDGGSLANDNWATIQNWNDDLLPGDTANIVFGTGFLSGPTIDTGSDRTMNSLTINTLTGFSLNGNNVFTITSGALTRNDLTGTEGDHIINQGITIGAAGNFTINGSGTLTINGVIADGINTFGLTKNGTGTVIFTGGAETYGGDTTINGGILQLGANEQIPVAGNLVVNSGGKFDLATFDETINGLSGSGIVDSSTGNGATLTIGSGNASTTFSGTIQNTDVDAGDVLNLVKTGTGTQTLSGNNSYRGDTTIQTGGALNIQHPNALGTADGGTTVNSGGTLQIQGSITIAAEALTLNGTGVGGLGALRNISGNNVYAGLITVGEGGSTTPRINSDAGTLTLSGGIGEAGGATKTLTIGGSGNVTITGNITGAADLGLAKDGAGTLTLSGAANSYTAGTTLSAGHLALGADNVIPDTGTFTFAGGILTANNRNDHIGPMSLTVNSTLDFSPGGAAGFLSFNGGPVAPGALTLTINGWTGLANASGTDDRIYLRTGADVSVPATADFLNGIVFTGFGFAPGAIQLASGEIVPVPEPINVALGIFAATLVMGGIVRRLRGRACRQA